MPNTWNGGPEDFGLQDKSGALHLGKASPKGSVIFDLSLDVKSEESKAPVLLSEFAHGPPKARFLYLSWRSANGAFAQRIKLPLAGITWSDVRKAQSAGKPLIAEVSGKRPSAAKGVANLGGTRSVVWRSPAG